MKRILSIFLLLVMLVTGVHPVLAFHYCSGSLSSVKIMNHNSHESCCMAREGDHENGSGSESHTALRFGQLHKKCCELQKIEISTDDFNHQVQPFNLDHLLLSFDHVWLILNYVSNPLELDDSRTVQHLFPPGGLNKLTIDWLAYICIYRI